MTNRLTASAPLPAPLRQRRPTSCSPVASIETPLLCYLDRRWCRAKATRLHVRLPGCHKQRCYLIKYVSCFTPPRPGASSFAESQNLFSVARVHTGSEDRILYDHARACNSPISLRRRLSGSASPIVGYSGCDHHRSDWLPAIEHAPRVLTET